MAAAGGAALAWALGLLLALPGGAAEVEQKEAEFDRTYEGLVTGNLLNIYAFNHTVARNRTEGVRVSVNVLSKQNDMPVLFVVRQKEAVVSFQVPLVLRGLYQRKYQYQDVSRTLCQPQTKMELETQHFYVDVSTLSLRNTSYKLRVTRVENFVLRTDERFSFNATAAQPQYFKYEFSEGVDSVIVKVTSAMAFPCSVISIQDILCPVYDLDNNVAFIGMYQTMTKKAAITVQKKDFPSNSFYVVVVVKTEDEACGGALPYYPFSKDEPIDQGNRQKTLEVVVSPAITSEAYVSSVLFCLGVFFSFYVITLLIACWESCCQQQRKKGLLAAMDSPTLDTASLLGHSRSIPDSFLGHAPYDSYGYGSFGECGMPSSASLPAGASRHTALPPRLTVPAENGSSASTEGITDSMGSTEVSYGYAGQDQFKRRVPTAQMRQLCIAMGDRSLENVASRPRLDSLSSVEEDDYDTLADINYDKNVIRTKQYLYVADLARKDKRVLRKKYQIYFWNIATIAVFYALPVIQLVITYQTVVNVTGNQDICYYNFLCAHPLGNLSAFNNILSNLGYILLGLLFLLIILQREINYNRALMRSDTHALECGIPKHFGLFYAMGTALMMEGLLSACYHVCPNYTNFQFDTSFMYMIAGLCMLKLYQKRHPDINASAYSAYACLAIVIFFSVVGVPTLPPGLRQRQHGLLDRLLYHPHHGHPAAEHPALLHGALEAGLGHPAPDRARAVHGLRPAVQWAHVRGSNGALGHGKHHQLVALRSGERIKLIPLLCIISTSVVWGFALFFFFQGLSTWQKTPAESREHNRDCILLDFFDDHDIWHFLSSVAMFGSFLVLLTLDDDLDCVQRDKIYVF
ncbi:SID1 transmembrane family member 2 isoform X5 [Struthio camelus]|uniref:SID1 transmembrane family member 2 isoform X5 n=1 Tax=Struthio camelus TaxID=8801 RepID=UPI003603B2DA